MPKKKTISEFNLFITIIIVSVCLLFLVSFIHLQQAQTDAEQYEEAAFCQDRDDCRKEEQAEILSSFTVDLDHIPASRYQAGREARVVSYLIGVKLPHGEIYHIKILPNLDLNTTAFKLKNVYLPVPQHDDKKMAEATFHPGNMVKIEMWNHKPTIIYAAFVLGAPALASGSEYAIPTTENPLVYYSREHYDFINMSVALGIAMLLMVGLRLFLKKR